MNKEIYLELQEEQIFKEELESLKASKEDFRLFVQEVGHVDDDKIKSLHVAYMLANRSKSDADYSELGRVFDSIITHEFTKEAESETKHRVEDLEDNFTMLVGYKNG